MNSFILPGRLELTHFHREHYLYFRPLNLRRIQVQQRSVRQTVRLCIVQDSVGRAQVPRHLHLAPDNPFIACLSSFPNVLLQVAKQPPRQSVPRSSQAYSVLYKRLDSASIHQGSSALYVGRCLKLEVDYAFVTKWSVFGLCIGTSI